MTLIYRWLLAACLALTLTLGAGGAYAQDGSLDYTAWNKLADSAEQVIDEGDETNEQFETLRSEIAGWRDSFLQAQSTNATRLRTLQSQIDALGPAPEEGATEAEGIATRRAELTAEIQRLEAPVRSAEEAYTRADGLIREIDEIIRARQTTALLEQRPSPLYPANWRDAAVELVASGQSIWAEFEKNIGSETKFSVLKSNLPVILLLLGIAGLLVVRGPVWIRKLVDWLRVRTRRGTGVWSFVVSLGGFVLPLIGLILLTVALTLSNVLGENGSVLLEQLPNWGGTLLWIRWLADQTFNRSDDVATLPLPLARRREARFYANMLAILLVLRSIGETFSSTFNYSETTSIVLDFPVLVLCALMLWRLGHILGQLSPETATDGTLLEGSQFRLRMTRIIGRGAMVAAIVGPIMSAIGYDGVGQALVYPAVRTLSLLALILVLQRFINDLYELFTGKSAQDADSLVPVLAGLMLLLATIPLLALVWGARVADLTEIWARFREGFSFGETRISPTDFLTFLLVFAVGYAVTRLVQAGLRSSILPKTRIDQGGQTAIVSGLGYVGIFAAALVAITAAGLDLSSLALVASALSVGIGFGLQNIVSNFVAGIILLIERPISEGDWIETGGTQGIVKSISVRSTRIETFDRTDLIVPNSDFVSGRVTNFTRSNVLGRVVVPVGVAYGSDTRKVEDILRRIVREHDMVLLNPEPMITFEEFGADSLNFFIRAVIRDVGSKLVVTSDFHHEIARRFAEEGIEIPFAQRDVWLRNPEVLFPDRGKPEAETPPPADPDSAEKPANQVAAKREERQQARDSGVMPAGRDGDDGGGSGDGGDGDGR
ncbi:Small-conductance mechanosensitive channel [Salipiger thiooxidans]|uniref:Small-conductance mechanosensitive channel n=2 Tax=Salipiger TaxID=263377 RepID=A0A1G7GL64_9RHOB|nr:DUF3772 domain-containing protein [Salipiger thiooxidans]SDE88877.1 Small-conductance mechanosensitive channel [Salipiger thiooxidans]